MNGTACGPNWLPQEVKNVLFGWFFEASCIKHDEGYREGGSEFRRWECDFKFFVAMLKDTFDKKDKWVPVKLITSVVYYLAVMLGGWTTFNYKTNA